MKPDRKNICKTFSKDNATLSDETGRGMETSCPECMAARCQSQLPLHHQLAEQHGQFLESLGL